MTLGISQAAADFIEHYGRDANLRWSPDDLIEQTKFVRGCIDTDSWLDWSSQSAALQLLQAKLLSMPTGFGERFDKILIAGPMAELMEATELLSLAIPHLRTRGSVIGIVPCLRDNSPESQVFADLAASKLWNYHTAEDWMEMIRDAGLNFSPGANGFIAIPRFSECILKDELCFKGFRQVFDEMEKLGYDPMEVGWGELRFIAALVDDSNS